MDALASLDRSAARVVELVAATDRSQWELPTPCTEWTVRELIGHLLGGMVGYTELLRGASAQEFRAAAQQAAASGDDDLTAAVTEAAARAREAFAEPGALERVVHHPMRDMPGAQLLGLRIGDNVVHAWDLATALGLPPRIDEELAEQVYQGLVPMAAVLPATGLFAAPRGELPPDAGPQERLLHVTGR